MKNLHDLVPPSRKNPLPALLSMAKLNASKCKLRDYKIFCSAKISPYSVDHRSVLSTRKVATHGAVSHPWSSPSCRRISASPRGG